MGRLFRKPKNNNENLPTSSPLPSEKQVKPVSSSLDENLALITEILGSDDTVTGEFEIAGGQGRAGIAYIKGIVDKNVISEQILIPLINKERGPEHGSNFSRASRLEVIRTRMLSTVNVKKTNRIEQVIEGLLSGNTVLFIDGGTDALIIGTSEFEKRQIEKPETEASVRGSSEAFVDDIGTNITMLRRRLRTPDLELESFIIGRLSRTEVRLVWIEGVANPKIVEEARRRIRRIDIDFIFGAAMIVELLEDSPMAIWPQIRLTERPDVVAANMVEGRFAVFVDGAPYVMVAPSLFWQNLQTVDDYGEAPVIGTFFRLIRHGAFYISLMATSLYVAIVTFHHSIIPPVLAIRIAAGRETVPFPSLVEAFFLSLAIDLLREAGIRLPKAIGSAVGILGAVVIGQAAVSAGFVSPALIIVVAISSISNFSIPSVSVSNAVRLANYILIILGGTMGLFGVVLGMVFLLWGIISQRSFGIPFFYPVAPGERYGLLDTFIRAPLWKLRRRPSLLSPDNQVRVGESTVKPDPKNRGGGRGR
ncbi:MAG: spore germination protein [Bacillota bacterium]